jgi:hypothetical protein
VLLLPLVVVVLVAMVFTRSAACSFWHAADVGGFALFLGHV